MHFPAFLSIAAFDCATQFALWLKARVKNIRLYKMNQKLILFKNNIRNKWVFQSCFRFNYELEQSTMQLSYGTIIKQE